MSFLVYLLVKIGRFLIGATLNQNEKNLPKHANQVKNRML